MRGFQGDALAAAGGERYRALLDISKAIISHRDLEPLFRELASRLHQLVRFDYVAVVLYEAATNKHDILRFPKTFLYHDGVSVAMFALLAFSLYYFARKPLNPGK